MSVSTLVMPFREEDRAPLLQLWREVFPDDPPWNNPEAMLDRKMSIQPELIRLAWSSVGLLEGAAMGGFDGVRGWIYHLAVRPKARRQGVATALVHSVIEGLGELGCPKVNLQVRAGNEDAVAFYRSLGFQIEDRVSLGLRLSPR